MKNEYHSVDKSIRSIIIQLTIPDLVESDLSGSTSMIDAVFVWC